MRFCFICCADALDIKLYVFEHMYSLEMSRHRNMMLNPRMNGYTHVIANSETYAPDLTNEHAYM